MCRQTDNQLPAEHIDF